MKGNRGLGTIYQRRGVWWIQFYVRGERYRESSGSHDRSDAVTLLKDRIADVKTGKPIGNQIEKTTLTDLRNMVLADYKANSHRSHRRAAQGWTHLLRLFGPDRRAVEITCDQITLFQSKRLDEGAAPSTINYETTMLRRGFRLAAEAKKVGIPPTIKNLRLSNARKGFFEPEQYRAVLRHLPGHLQALVTAAYISGWRRSELTSRQWRHVDFDHGWIRLDPGESKNGEGREFPLTPELKTVLERQREFVRSIEHATDRIVPWVFSTPRGDRLGDFRDAWRSACRLAGVTGRLMHDFRRSAVRNLERAGIPRSAAMKMSGHLTESIYKRYAIVDSAMLQDAAVKLANLHAADEAAQK